MATYQHLQTTWNHFLLFILISGNRWPWLIRWPQSHIHRLSDFTAGFRGPESTSAYNMMHLYMLPVTLLPTIQWVCSCHRTSSKTNSRSTYRPLSHHITVFRVICVPLMPYPLYHRMVLWKEPRLN